MEDVPGLGPVCNSLQPKQSKASIPGSFPQLAASLTLQTGARIDSAAHDSGWTPVLTPAAVVEC
jgi:hypothetical protein